MAWSPTFAIRSSAFTVSFHSSCFAEMSEKDLLTLKMIAAMAEVKRQPVGEVPRRKLTKKNRDRKEFDFFRIRDDFDAEMRESQNWYVGYISTHKLVCIVPYF